MSSPMMVQWESCKREAKDAILLFRLGDFYEAFGDDAKLIARELGLTLTKRQETPMAGVPFHTCEGYIDKLVGKGYRVAIAEQMEDPKNVKGLVKRQVVRTVTPGTVITSNLLLDKTANYIAAIAKLNATFGLAIMDLTTSDFRVMEFEDGKDLEMELARLAPKEIVVSKKIQTSFEMVSIERRDDWFFDIKSGFSRLIKHFQTQTLDGFGLQGLTAAIGAAGALLAYIEDDLSLPTHHIKKIRLETSNDFMALDATTQRHLEIPKLLDILDFTVTPMGGRKLKEWLLHPLLSVKEIHERQHKIEKLLSCSELADPLSTVRDLERLTMRIQTGYATPRDVAGLRFSLESIPKISLLLEKAGFSGLPDLSFLVDLIAKALIDAPPLRLSDGHFIRAGFNQELDELRSLKTDSQSWMLKYQTELREKTQIKTLKVGYTPAFGYYIEVSRGASDKMPLSFHRKQTLTNAERFISPELKEFEHKILTAESRISSIETELFHQIRAQIVPHAELIREAASQIATWDTLLSLSLAAQKHRFKKPIVDESDRIDIKAGRHPVIEAMIKESFVPNDLHLSEKNRLMIITGPNMAGKSTYIRQAALICILAQIGSFVPAESAHIGLIDRLFTRIGASDDLSRGQSTFMVEMTETASILNNATDRSLVILDEIGRGTSTYDGIAIAWAVADYLLTIKHPKTLFATHYLELTEIEGAVNASVAVHETPQGIVFLHKIVKGPADKSYGIHVAKLAGLPSAVIHKAEEMLLKLHATPQEKAPPTEHQLELF
jgi:DNA mismatch repair protein MutS